jgi:hypothetical protein
MTVSSTTSKVSYTGNGSTTAFAVPFYFLAAADLQVILRSGTTETVQVLTTNYTVSGAGNEAGGTVTMLVAPAAAVTVTIRRNIAATQETDLLPNDRLPAESLETALDKVTMLTQQLGEESARSLKYPASDAVMSAQVPAASARASKFLSFDANGLPVATVGVDATTDIFTQSGTGAVPRSVNSKLRDTVSAKDFGAVGDGATNDTAALQAAIDYCFSNSITLYIPSGTYSVTGLAVTGGGLQNKILKIVGDGFGNPFATWNFPSGTVIKSTTNAPVFKISVPIVTTTAGTFDVQGVAFDGNSTTPVVDLEAFYGVGKIDRCAVFQRGTGNGIESDWMTTSEISHTYVLNKDWAVSGLGASRTGIGVFLNHQYDSGLQTLRKVTSRGFLTGYKVGVGGGTAYTYSASIEDCEASVTYNGIHLTDNARATLVSNCYLEGGEGGVGIWDQGDYNKVLGCFTFAGYGTHLKSTDNTYGNYYVGNTFAAGTTANQTLIDITSIGTFGGPGKTCSDNHLSFGGSGGSIAGVIGLRINGTSPRLNLLSNSFLPRGPWIGGAGTTKISDLSSGGVFGMTTAISKSGELEIPMLSRGAIALEGADSGLSQLDVSSNVLSVPGGSLFYCNASSAVTVNKLSTGSTAGRLLIFNLENTNMTFSAGAYMLLNGGVNFSSIGHIVFYTKIIGADVYAYELCRSTY